MSSKSRRKLAPEDVSRGGASVGASNMSALYAGVSAAVVLTAAAAPIQSNSSRETAQDSISQGASLESGQTFVFGSASVASYSTLPISDPVTTTVLSDSPAARIVAGFASLDEMEREGVSHNAAVYQRTLDEIHELQLAESRKVVERVRALAEKAGLRKVIEHADKVIARHKLT